MIDRENVENRSYQNLKQKFKSVEYDYILKLDSTRFNGKRKFDYKDDFNFEEHKLEEIRDHFIFSSTSQFDKLFTAIDNSLLLKPDNLQVLRDSLNSIIIENFKIDHKIGFKLLLCIFNNYKSRWFELSSALRHISQSSKEFALQLWNLIRKTENDYKNELRMSFLRNLPPEFVNVFYKNQLIETVNTIERHSYIPFNDSVKFLVFDGDLFVILLKIIVEKTKLLNIRIDISHSFFEKYAFEMSNNHVLLEKAYLQQVKQDPHYDLYRLGLKALCEINPNFFMVYLKDHLLESEYNRYKNNRENLFPFIWDLPNCEFLLEEAINLIVENKPFLSFSFSELLILFDNLSDDNTQRAKSFFLGYITKYNTSALRIKYIFDCINRHFNGFFEEAIIKFLSLNKNIDIFKEIQWVSTGGVYRNDENVGDMEVIKWEKVLSMIQKMPNKLDLLEIKLHVERRIGGAKQYAESIEERNFIEPN